VGGKNHLMRKQPEPEQLKFDLDAGQRKKRARALEEDREDRASLYRGPSYEEVKLMKIIDDFKLRLKVNAAWTHKYVEPIIKAIHKEASVTKMPDYAFDGVEKFIKSIAYQKGGNERDYVEEILRRHKSDRFEILTAHSPLYRHAYNLFKLKGMVEGLHDRKQEYFKAEYGNQSA